MKKSRKPKSALAIINAAIRKAETRQKRKTALVNAILPGNIPAGMVLHFWDNNEHNGHFSNLIVCPNKEYSDRLHKEVLSRFGSYHEFIKSRDRFRKNLKREHIAQRLDAKMLREIRAIHDA